MRTELLGQEKNVVRVKVEFEAEEFMSKLNEVVSDLTQHVSIPGFRKGRIPRKMLEMRFGKDNIHKEALEKMLPEAIKQVTDDYDLDIMDTPSLLIDDITEGQPVTCELTFEVRPEVELPELEDIEVEKLRQEVKDDTLDLMTAQFREQFATLNLVDRPAEEKDMVSATFVTHVFGADGNEASPPSEPTPSNIDLSAASVRAEVKSALLGKSKGDEASAEFEIESNYRDATLAGRKIRYDIKVDGINEKILPEMGPEFFKKVLNTDAETEEDFRNEMKKRMLEHEEGMEADRVSEEAIRIIVGRSKLEIPDSLLERQSAYVREQDAADVKRRFNSDMEEYLSKSGIAPVEYEQMVREKAESALRRTLVMDEIGDLLDIDVKKEDIEAEISNLSAMHGIERAKVRAHYYQNEANMSQLSNGLRYDKISKAILDKIKVTEVDKLTAEEPSADESPAPEAVAESAE